MTTPSPRRDLFDQLRRPWLLVALPIAAWIVVSNSGLFRDRLRVIPVTLTASTQIISTPTGPAVPDPPLPRSAKERIGEISIFQGEALRGRWAPTSRHERCMVNIVLYGGGTLTDEERLRLLHEASDLLARFGRVKHPALVAQGGGTAVVLLWDGYVSNGAVMALPALWVLVVIATLRGSPARRRARALACGRCPTCGYAIHGLLQPQCPECGDSWEARFGTPEPNPANTGQK
ncbi:MAG: hypothetical protein KF745_09520 [Phycisphaeraceae bacterium]|nr:hypothetical protein [Phycisphaeraceae bacterium]